MYNEINYFKNKLYAGLKILENFSARSQKACLDIAWAPGLG